MANASVVLIQAENTGITNALALESSFWKRGLVGQKVIEVFVLQNFLTQLYFNILVPVLN